jgi:LPS sulfotransferase NodH
MSSTSSSSGFSRQQTGFDPPTDARPVNFVLLGHPRCGSNLLLRALAEHPQVRMVGEALAPDPHIRKFAWSWAKPDFDGYQSGQDGGQFLEHAIFAKPPLENVTAFGFKLFYDQARSDEFIQTAWDYILSHDIRIVHLVRRNLLYSLISFETAERTQRWHHVIENADEKFPPFPPFALDPAVCRAYFDNVTGWRNWVKEKFATRSVLTVEYEKDLCTDFRRATFAVFNFLGVLRWHLRPGLIKQQTVTASQQISNFGDLRGYFQDTPYAEFFENSDSPEGIRPATLTK